MLLTSFIYVHDSLIHLYISQLLMQCLPTIICVMKMNAVCMIQLLCAFPFATFVFIVLFLLLCGFNNHKYNDKTFRARVQDLKLGCIGLRLKVTIKLITSLILYFENQLTYKNWSDISQRSAILLDTFF